MKVRDQLGWLARGVPPSRIGWGPGPVTTVRQARHRLLRRPVRLALLEHADNGTRFAAPHAFWINQRSRVCVARVNDTRGADLVWVLSQDPLPASAQRTLDASVAGFGRGATINPVETYDAYHHDDAFERLAAAGVCVPRTRFTTEDVGRTTVVYKAQWQQPSAKHRDVYRGPLEGYRAFEYVDGRGTDGLPRRYRAFWLCGRAWPNAGMASPGWEVTGRTRTQVDTAFVLTDHEREQLDLLGQTLGLDFFAVDFLRRREDAAPVFVDINVYPTLVDVIGGDERGEHGQWHVFDTRDRLGTAAPDEDVWRDFDAVMLELVGAR